MNFKKADLTKARNLLNRAEKLAKNNVAMDDIDIDSLSQEDINKVVHDLQVHQIELELQNEELRNIQSELETSRAMFFELYNMAPVGYMTLDDNGFIMEVNLTFCNLLGYQRQDIIRKPITNYIFSDDQDIFYKHKKQFQDLGKIATCKLRMLAHNGKKFYVCMEATRIYDKEIDEFVYNCVIRDISEEKHHEQMLNKQFILMQALINSPNDMIYSLDNEYRYTAFNKNHKEEMRKDWQAEIEIGESILDYINIPEYAEKTKQSIDKVLKGVRFIEVVHLVNQNVYYEMDWKPIIDGTLKIVGVTSIVRDITAHKIAEEIIQNNNVEIERKVKDRTIALELSTNELNTFSSNVAHNFTKPLQRIDEISLILLEDDNGVLDAEDKLLVDEIRENTNIMKKLLMTLPHS